MWPEPVRVGSDSPGHARAAPAHHIFHAVRADMLRRLGRVTEAAAAFEAAIAGTENESERDLLLRTRRQTVRSLEHE